MEKRRLGRSDLEVSAIGLGCMGMGFAYEHLRASVASHLRPA